MKVRLLPADEAGCSFYRHECPAEAARAEGVDAHIDRQNFTIYEAPFGKVIANTEPEGEGVRITEWPEDVIVLQRPAKIGVLNIIPILQARGMAVVVDVDDDFSCLHPAHPAFDHFNPNLNPVENWHHLRKACALADMVTVTTPALAERYGSHGRVAVLPNYVPAEMLEMPRSSDGHTLGWSGSKQGHPGDLEVTRGGVGEALARSSCWRFRTIGPDEGVGEALGVKHVDATGYLSVEDYQRELGSLDVGICPLGDTAFNRSKSSLKLLEQASRGVSCVASPTPAYEALVEEGIGVLAADRARNWRSALSRLMADESLRWEMAEQARAVIAEHHTYERNGWRWCEAWEAALTNRRSRGGPVRRTVSHA